MKHKATSSYNCIFLFHEQTGEAKQAIFQPMLQ